jgi:chromate transporter
MSLDVPVLRSADVPAMALAAAAMVAMLRYKLGMVPVLAVAAGMGVAWRLFTGW